MRQACLLAYRGQAAFVEEALKAVRRCWGGRSRRILLMRRQGKVKCRPVKYIWLDPYPPTVSCDDRTADREPHAHATGFGGEEGVEQPVRGPVEIPTPLSFTVTCT
jgi:hypothetical protein